MTKKSSPPIYRIVRGGVLSAQVFHGKGPVLDFSGFRSEAELKAYVTEKYPGAKLLSDLPFIQEVERRLLKKTPKYRNRKVIIDDFQFDSQKEGNRYEELRRKERAGEIRNLELQPRYDIVVEGRKICFYKADFRYRDVMTGKEVVEDVKGVRTRDYKLKKKLVEALYKIEIIEI